MMNDLVNFSVAPKRNLSYVFESFFASRSVCEVSFSFHDCENKGECTTNLPNLECQTWLRTDGWK
jgi:hypothetical protein